MLLGRSLDSTPDRKSWYVRFRKDYEICGVLGCLLDEGDALLGDFLG